MGPEACCCYLGPWDSGSDDRTGMLLFYINTGWLGQETDTRKLETTIAGPSVIINTLSLYYNYMMNVWSDILTDQKWCGVLWCLA